MTEDSSKRVLVAEDDASIREMLVSVLRRKGLVVDEAVDGSDALDKIMRSNYSVVLLDLAMPLVSGFEVLDRLAEEPAHVAPIVLVVTGADRSATRKLDSKRIHGVVRKPFDVEELASIVLACAEIRERNTFGTMAIATMLAGSPLLALLNRFPH